MAEVSDAHTISETEPDDTGDAGGVGIVKGCAGVERAEVAVWLEGVTGQAADALAVVQEVAVRHAARAVALQAVAGNAL